MSKATTLTFAAALLAASCGLAMAQGAGADKTEGSEAGPGRPALLQSPQATSAPESNKMQQKKANLNTRQKTGTAKVLAGPGRMRQQTR
jgi:hypothetical protein